MNKVIKKKMVIRLKTKDVIEMKEVLEFTADFFRDGTVGARARKLLETLNATQKGGAK